jgi:hypothetical protein
MRNKIIALNSLLLLVILFSSCRTYLTPALLGNNMGYLARPMEADSIKSFNHVTASYAGAASPDNGKVTFELGMLNINRGHTFKGFNIAYGAFGYLGKVSNSYAENATIDPREYPPSFKKNIYGFGLRSSIGLHNMSSNGNTDFRFINWENAISTEKGSYTNFRDQVYNSRIYDYAAVSDRKVLWTTGLSTEVIWRARQNHDIKHAFRLFIGGTPGLADSFKYGKDTEISKVVKSSAGWSFSYFLYIKKFTLSLEGGKNLNVANKISLGYAFW